MNQTILKLFQGNESKYPKYIEEHYPQIFEKLLEYWETCQMYPYLDELMMSKREGRQGFPPEAAVEVWTLNSLYLAMYPNPDKGLGTDIWLEDSTTEKEVKKMSEHKSNEG